MFNVIESNPDIENKTSNWKEINIFELYEIENTEDKDKLHSKVGLLNKKSSFRASYYGEIERVYSLRKVFKKFYAIVYHEVKKTKTHCCKNKKSYKNKTDALIAAYNVGRRSVAAKTPKRAYHCPECSKWHLTSKR